MKTDSTHIHMVLDRTGSMSTIREDTIGGVNTFVKAQQDLPGDCSLTLVQFDSQDPYEVIHQMKPVAEIPALTEETYVPRAMTPLLDAMGRGIHDLEKCLADLKKKKRPKKVVFVVITDGQENSSHEFTKANVADLIAAKEKEGWQFVFLGADLSGIGDAAAMGVRLESTMAFDNDADGVRNAFCSTAENVANYRTEGASGVTLSYSAEQRSLHSNEAKRNKPTPKVPRRDGVRV